jgi:hypothetical protein
MKKAEDIIFGDKEETQMVLNHFYFHLFIDKR